MSYIEKEYKQFVGYVKGTWNSLTEEWAEEPIVERICVSLDDNTFDVVVYFKPNSYPVYDFENRELLEAKYEGKGIHTSYYLRGDIILHMLFNANIISDLGLEDIKIINVEYLGGIYDEALSKELHNIEMDWGYDLYCMEHDL